MLSVAHRIALRSPQDCFTQSAGLLYAVRRIALRSPQDCFTQSAGLLYAVRKIAKRSRSNTAFQLPRFTFSTGPFDRLRDPFRAQGSWAAAGLLYAVRRVAERSPQHCFTQSAGLLSAVCRVAERSRSNTAFQLPRFTFSTGPFDRLRDPFRAQGSYDAKEFTCCSQ